MDNFGLVLILVLIVLIFISAFFSGSETSITAINQIKLDSAAESGQKSAKRVNSLRNRINEVLGFSLFHKKRCEEIFFRPSTIYR